MGLGPGVALAVALAVGDVPALAVGAALDDEAALGSAAAEEAGIVGAGPPHATAIRAVASAKHSSAAGRVARCGEPVPVPDRERSEARDIRSGRRVSMRATGPDRTTRSKRRTFIPHPASAANPGNEPPAGSSGRQKLIDASPELRSVQPLLS